MKRRTKMLVTVSSCFLGIALMVSQIGAQQKPIISIDGSSTVFPITEAVAEEFQTQQKGNVRVTVGISGTGGGFKKFCRGEIDIADASRPILYKEMSACREAGIQFIELPVAYDALTVMVHPKNDWAATMTVAELKMIWEPAAQNKLLRWNQIRENWPNKPIKLYGAGADSGTFDYFTEAIVGKAKSSRGDYTASEDDNVLVQGIAHDENALGYFGFAYYVENQSQLKAVSIDQGKGGILPSPKNVEDGSYQPLSRPIFIYVSRRAMKRPGVKEFVNFYLDNASRLVQEVKYIALPGTAYELTKERFNAGKTGTAFAGQPAIGVGITEILKRKTKS